MAPSSRFSSSSTSSSKEDIEDTVGLLESASDKGGSEPPLRLERQSGSKRTYSRTALALGLSNITTLIFLATTLLALTQRPSRCPLPVNQPPTGVARAVEHLATPPRPQFLNVTFYDHDHSVFRAHNSTAADDAWYDYSQVLSGVVLISKEDAAQADIDPARHAYLDAPERGLVGYPVKIEAIHQMHCLNLMRMHLYYNYPHTKETCGPPICAGPEEYVRLHIDHCVEVLRLRIQCTADVGITPLVWLGQKGRLTGDMGRMHTCGNYEAVRRFAKEKTVPTPREGDVLPKPGDFYVKDYI